jgi:hypothetical protein
VQPGDGQCGGEQDDGPCRGVQGRFQWGQERALVEGEHVTVAQGDLTLHLFGPPADRPGRSAQAALGGRQGEGPGRRDDRAQGEAARLGHVGDEDGEGAPGQCEPEVGMEQPPEELPVVRHHEHGPEHHERDQGPPDAGQPDYAEGDRARQARHRHRHQYRGGYAGPERAAVELIERMGGEPHGEEERQERGEQPGQLDAGGQRGADHHVGQVPGRVRRVEQGPPVPPPAGAGGVEGGAALYPRGVTHCSGCPTSPGHRRGS